MTTDDDGRFRIIELKPGTYKVSASQTGFGTREKTDLTTISGQNVQIDFQLAPADVQVETLVSITDEDVTIDTTRTVVGGTVTQLELEELPSTNREALDFVFTLGGVTEEPLSIRDVAEDRAASGVNEVSGLIEGGIFSLSGGAAYSNNITIDGLDNNDDRGATERFQPSIDAIAEVQVITNQFSAEYGRASGGRVNIRTRAGSNRFRGRAYMFFADDNLNANTYNNNRRNLSRLPFTEYNPGATLSGPIPFGYFKNKTYFFSSYEYKNRSDTTLIDNVLPVAQNPRFALPAPTNPNAQRCDIAVCTSSSAGALIAPFITTIETPSLNHIFTQRVDHNFTGTHNITLSYQLGRNSNFRQYLDATRVLEEAIQGRTRKNDAFYFTDNFVFNSNIVNQFRYQFSKYKPDFASENPLDPVVLIRVRDSQTGTDNRSGTLTAGNSTANFVSTREESRHQIQDTLSYLVGNHSLKFGGDVQLINSENLALGDATGTYNFDSVGDFLTNRVIRFRRNFGTNSEIQNNYYGFFFQDEWKTTPNLTLSVGFRYEKETIVNDNNNFGPRFGLAYAPSKNNKSVIRFGAGIFYNRALLRTLDDYSLGRLQILFDTRNIPGPAFDNQCFLAANVNQPRCRFLAAISNSFPTAPTEQDIRSLLSDLGTTGGFATATNFTRLVDPEIKIPESYQFNVGYEREIGNGFFFESNFTFNKTVHLWRETNINFFVLPQNFNTYTDYLLSLAGVQIGNTNYRFELGNSNDGVGLRTPTNTPCAVGTPICIVNLNTINNSEGAGGSTTLPAPITIARSALGATLSRAFNNNLQQVEQVSSIGQSVYEGLTFELRRGFRKLGRGFRGSLRFAYTLSRLRDDGIVNTSSAQIPGDFGSEFGTSIQDRRHYFKFSGTVEMPQWLGKLRLSPYLRLGSGRPFNLSNGGFDRSLDDVSGDRPNFTGDLSLLRSREPGDTLSQTLINSLTYAPIGSPRKSSTKCRSRS